MGDVPLVCSKLYQPRPWIEGPVQRTSWWRQGLVPPPPPLSPWLRRPCRPSGCAGQEQPWTNCPPVLKKIFWSTPPHWHGLFSLTIGFKSNKRPSMLPLTIYLSGHNRAEQHQILQFKGSETSASVLSINCGTKRVPLNFGLNLQTWILSFLYSKAKKGEKNLYPRFDEHRQLYRNFSLHHRVSLEP